MVSRRSFLSGALGASVAISGRAWAAPNADVKLLVVFLRGAYDAANVVIPTSQSFYYEARPTLSIARPDPGNPLAALPLDADWSLHPALKDTLYPLWSKGQVAFVPFIGSDDPSRSHFATQNTIELGQPYASSRNYSSGFMGRLNDELQDRRAIAFTGSLPVIFDGRRLTPNLALGGAGRAAIPDQTRRRIQDMYQGTPLAAAVNLGFETQADAYQKVSQETKAADGGAPSPKGFEVIGRRMGMLMRGDYNLAFTDVGGWDTHVNQGAAQGVLADHLGQLGRGLSAFADELGPDAWSKTVVVVISEFGRTFRENGDRGTDHGHGSTYWVMGGGVRGGRFTGPQVKLAPETLNQNRDLPILTDYKAFFGGLFSRLYGLKSDALQRIFPATTPVDLTVV